MLSKSRCVKWSEINNTRTKKTSATSI